MAYPPSRLSHIYTASGAIRKWHIFGCRAAEIWSGCPKGIAICPRRRARNRTGGLPVATDIETFVEADGRDEKIREVRAKIDEL
ncbi:MAG: hypothetical protein AAF568_08590, partial [Pseudomonadota bacterium]